MNNNEPFSSNQQMYDRINYLEHQVQQLEEENTYLNSELEDAYEDVDNMKYELYDEQNHD